MNINNTNSTSFIDQSNRSQTLDRTEVKQSNTTSASTDTFSRSNKSETLTTYFADARMNTDMIEISDSLDAKRRSSKLRSLV